MFDDLSTTIIVLFVLGILLVCFFEFINGFHDTANAVATVIYTNSLKPTYAVIYSGILNFLGVITGGIAVAMTIVNLLPVDQIIDGNIVRSLSMIYALIISAIVWNFGTWYYGIPASSSHTIIGSIIGIGIGFYFLPGNYGLSAVNWDKAKETGLSLLLSPLLGFALAIFIMFIFKRLVKNEFVYKEPIPGKKPPIWIRMMLWGTCGLVSFFHGQNDGQKGVGILMLVLIIVMPFKFSLDNKVNLQSIKGNLTSIHDIVNATDTISFGKDEFYHYYNVKKHYQLFIREISDKKYADELDKSKRYDIRKNVSNITKSADKLLKSENFAITKNNASKLRKEIRQAKKLIEFAPAWVILLISLCLGTGTMIGWKRIVVTVGEKIGKQHMSYAQGASAEIVASMGIGMASYLGLPVSTTHMLSSGIAGTMVAKKGLKNLQKKTVTNIVMAWVLTLPVTVILSCSLFLLFVNIFS
ncbi:MAG: inorganic phosphate transporter [Bacteroidia bacterium]|nr:inorganic phosphate transporter [Bacteroidia bacterium]